MAHYPQPYDPSTARKAGGHLDKQWFSYGTVEPETDGGKSVQFTKEYGPLVNVQLHPSGAHVVCRVSSYVAGNGEGEWFPFLEGDEVIVGIPEGDERAGCCIIGRMNQEIDAFPMQVAGQDVTQNNFAFRRMRTPYVLETAAGYLVRSATTGAFFGINPQGELTFSNSDKAFLTLGADILGMQSGDAKSILQLDLAKNQIHLEVPGTRFTIDSDATTFNTGGTIAIATSGGTASGHAVTLEQVINLLVNFVYVIAGPQGSSTLQTELGSPGKILSTIPGEFPAQFLLALTTMINAAANPILPTPATGGGLFFPGLPQVIAAALANPISMTDLTGMIPGVGRAGFTL